MSHYAVVCLNFKEKNFGNNSVLFLLFHNLPIKHTLTHKNNCKYIIKLLQTVKNNVTKRGGETEIMLVDSVT